MSDKLKPADTDELVKRLRERWEATDAPVAIKINKMIRRCKEAADAIECLERENARLNQCLKWEQHKTAQANGTTHSEDCHTWGPQHYECLMRKYEEQKP
jgi:hypothetical protein